jgi:hypothetical protein
MRHDEHRPVHDAAPPDASRAAPPRPGRPGPHHTEPNVRFARKGETPEWGSGAWPRTVRPSARRPSPNGVTTKGSAPSKPRRPSLRLPRGSSGSCGRKGRAGSIEQAGGPLCSQDERTNEVRTVGLATGGLKRSRLARPTPARPSGARNARVKPLSRRVRCSRTLFARLTRG